MKNFFTILCFSSLLYLNGCSECDRSQVGSIIVAVPETLGMKMDVTTKEEAKNILKANGYRKIIEAVNIGSAFLGSLNNKKENFEKMSTLIAFFDKNHWIGLHFDKNQKLVMFMTREREEILKYQSGRDDFAIPKEPGKKITNFREDFSEEWFIRKVNGDISYAVFSRNLLERLNKRSFFVRKNCEEMTVFFDQVIADIQKAVYIEQNSVSIC